MARKMRCGTSAKEDKNTDKPFWTIRNPQWTICVGAKHSMARATQTRKNTRIQREKTQLILDSALAVFSRQGFRGTTIDQIAEHAGISKPNILYYFDDKQSIHTILVEDILEKWLEPLAQIDPDGEPVNEILAYVSRKLDLAFDYPRESRLFAHEIMRGASAIIPALEQDLRPLVDEKVDLIRSWISQGRLAPVDPRHTLFMIWATTQHYSDFDTQVEAMCPDEDRKKRFDDARKNLEFAMRRMLTPTPG